MVMALSLAHKQEGQSLVYVVHMLQRVSTPGQVDTWPLFDSIQTSNPVPVASLWEATLVAQTGSELLPLSPSCPSSISLLLGLWSFSAWELRYLSSYFLSWTVRSLEDRIQV